MEMCLIKNKCEDNLSHVEPIHTSSVHQRCLGATLF